MGVSRRTKALFSMAILSVVTPATQAAPKSEPDEPEPDELDPEPPDAAPAFTRLAVQAVSKKKERLMSARRNCERWCLIDSPTESSQRSRRSFAAASWHASNSLYLRSVYLGAHDTCRRGCVVLFAAWGSHAIVVAAL